MAVDFKWSLDTVDEDGAPEQAGCWWRNGQMTSAIYTPLVKADAAVSLGAVSFLVRSTDDPYIKAQRLTDGSMYDLYPMELRFELPYTAYVDKCLRSASGAIHLPPLLRKSIYGCLVT